MAFLPCDASRDLQRAIALIRPNAARTYREPGFAAQVVLSPIPADASRHQIALRHVPAALKLTPPPL